MISLVCVNFVAVMETNEMEYFKKFIRLFKRKKNFSGFEVRLYLKGELQAVTTCSPISTLDHRLSQFIKVSENSFLSGYKLIPFLERTDQDGNGQDNVLHRMPL